MTKGIRDRGGVKEKRRSVPCGEEGRREDSTAGWHLASPWGPEARRAQTDPGAGPSGHSVTSCQVTEQTSLRPTETQTALMEHLFGAGHLTSFIPLY